MCIYIEKEMTGTWTLIACFLVPVSLIKLDAQDGPSFDELKTQVTVVVGETAVLPCKISNKKHYITSWIKSNNRSPMSIENIIFKGDSRLSVQRLNQDSWNLLIRNVSMVDQGGYKCLVNTNPISSKDVTLIVMNAQDGPSFDELETHVTVDVGETAVLPCKISNKKHYKVAWTNFNNIILSLDDRTLTVDSRLSVQRPNQDSWNLHIRRVSMVDQGGYKCSVNTDPISSKGVTLTVKNALDGPSFDELETHVTVDVGETAVLPCKISNKKHYKTSWVKSNNRSPMSIENIILKGDSRISVQRLNQDSWNLLIRNVSMVDQGGYKCLVNTNPISSKDVTLIVMITPKYTTTTAGPAITTTVKKPGELKGISESYLRIFDYTGDVTAAKGGDVTLWCKVEGGLESAVSWLTLAANGKQELKTESSTLNLYNVNESQEYECVATGPDGQQDNRHMRLNVEYAPNVEIFHNTTTNTLDCYIVGRPLEFHAWSRNGLIIRDNDNYQITECKTGESSIKYTLVINNPNVGDNFVCEAINTHGTSSAAVRITG